MTFKHLHKHLVRRQRGLLVFFFVLLGFFCIEGHGEGAGLFSSQSLNVEGSKLTVIPTDLDGRGLFEIVVVSKTGVYPKEKRWISMVTIIRTCCLPNRNRSSYTCISPTGISPPNHPPQSYFRFGRQGKTATQVFHSF